jgi:peptidoglycan/LPS O-acetylase OafA/YrhL
MNFVTTEPGIAAKDLRPSARTKCTACNSCEACSTAVKSKPPTNEHVTYLEGLRGLSAIWVVMAHAYFHTLALMPMTGWHAGLRDTIGWIFQARIAVCVFIVLSGYLLMRPVVRQGDGQMPGGVGRYLWRRCRRILPPYYAALALSIALIYLIPLLQGPISVEWNDSVPAFGNGTIAAHLFMVHNLSWRWASKIDSPMWSVATEWQIYFVFPLLLLPAWRRMGNVGSISIALALGVGFFLVTGKGHATAPWLLALFAFGMAAATCEAQNRETSATDNLKKRKRFGWMAVILFGSFMLITALCQMGKLRFLTVEGIAGLWPYNWAFDLWAGAGAACLLVYCRAAGKTRSHGLVQFLSWRWLVRAGTISYSLYLIHDPLQAVGKIGLNALRLTPYEQFGVLTLVGLPLILAATYLFHLIFERPLLNTSRGQQNKTAPSLTTQESPVAGALN